MNNLNILKKLSEAFGPSGFEEEINAIISKEFKSLNSFNRTEDGFRSVIFSKHNNQTFFTGSMHQRLDFLASDQTAGGAPYWDGHGGMVMVMGG